MLFIHEATVALKVIQLEDIIPRYLATCVLPVHVAGCATTIHYTLSLCPVSLCDPARGSPNAGVENSSKVYTQLLRSLFEQCWASARKGLHGKSKPPPTGVAVSSKGSQTEL